MRSTKVIDKTLTPREALHRPWRPTFQITRKRSSRLSAIAFLACVASVLAACGSSTPHARTSNTVGTSSNTTIEAGNGGTALTAVKAAVARLEQRPTSIEISTPIGAPIPKGKTIDFLQVSAPQAAYAEELFQQAASLVGWHVVPVQAGLTQATISAAEQQIVRNHPDAIAEAGLSRAAMGQQAISAFSAAKIPFLEVAGTDTPTNGIVGVIQNGAAYERLGSEMAQWIYADSQGNPNLSMAVGTSSIFQLGMSIYSGFVAEYGKLCPSCHISDISIAPADFGTPAEGNVVALYFRAHPQDTYYVGSTVDAESGVVSALQQAGVRGTKIVVGDVNNTALQQIGSGQVAAAGGIPWPENMARAVDFLARLFLGKSYAVDQNSPYPEMILTRANLPAKTLPLPLVANYQAQFNALWGLG